jgi:hypothetical protein
MDKWIAGLVDKYRTKIHLSKNPFILLPICLLALALVAGCAYSLGPTNGLSAGDKKIQITPFLNHTFEPRLGDTVTTAVRREIQRDGTYQLATRGEADIVVTGVLTRYNRHELNFQTNDVLTVKDYRVDVSALITAHNVSTGTTTSWTNTSYTLIPVGSDFASAERQAMPVLAQDLAKHVTDSLVNGTW